MDLTAIQKRARFLATGNETSTAYADAPLLASINEWYRTVANWIEDSSGTWQFADSNDTSLLEATSDLPNDTHSVDLPATGRMLNDVYYRNADDLEYYRLPQLDRSEIGPGKRYSSIKQLEDQDGPPLFYDLEGVSIIFYPSINSTHVHETDGLLINVGKEVTALAVAADVPGLPIEFHEALAIGAAMDYALAKENDTLERNMRRRLFGDPSRPDDKGIRGLISGHISKRNKDRKPKFRPRMERYN